MRDLELNNTNRKRPGSTPPSFRRDPVSQTLVATARTGGRPPLRQIASPVLRVLAAALEALAEARRLQGEAERRYRYLNFDC
jgi:hypothetical protein